MKSKVSIILGFIGVIICIFITDSDIRSTIFKISIGLILASIIGFIVYLIEIRNNWILLKTKLFKRSKPIRVTVAYLFRIEVNGKYALIKRHKKDRVGYQPIGGAFKYFKEESRGFFDEIGVEPCNLVPRDELTDNDLRIRINKRKNLIEFLNWFESRKNREIDPWREFYEELVEPGLLPSRIFKYVKYVFIGSHKELESPSPVFKIDEFRYAEIYELRPEGDKQKQAIENLISKKGDIIFATPDEIRKGSTDNGETILPHTFKILPK